ncbi:MAG: ribosomal RNA small subunit methyltransferase A [Deltaproteobacteria bacterium]|nr:ribosomal RNA small subunit methyltransferase A [Deltaproteobacteria bacterium]
MELGRSGVNAGQIRAFLERHSLLARRDLGQNFLCNAALAERLVGLAGVEPGDTVLEVGTGLGILTRALAGRAARVVTLEVDAGLVRALRAESLLPSNVELLHADALAADLPGLVAAAGTPVRVVANLPYVISGPLLRKLLDLHTALVDWSVMLQAEVGARLLAESNTKAYGSLTVLHRLLVDVKREMKLSGGCFFPAPKVHSVFLRMRPLARPALAAGELPEVERFLRAAFGQRRKTLANALRGAGFDTDGLVQQLDALGIDPRARAESLAPVELLALSRELRKAPP